MSLSSFLKSFFLGTFEEGPPSLLVDRHGTVINAELAAAFSTLLFDIALSDDVLQENEVKEIARILTRELSLSDEKADDIFQFALEARKESNELPKKLGPIALGLAEDQREYLLELAKRVASADDWISRDEEEIVARISEILRISPKK